MFLCSYLRWWCMVIWLWHVFVVDKSSAINRNDAHYSQLWLGQQWRLVGVIILKAKKLTSDNCLEYFHLICYIHVLFLLVWPGTDPDTQWAQVWEPKGLGHFLCLYQWLVAEGILYPGWLCICAWLHTISLWTRCLTNHSQEFHQSYNLGALGAKNMKWLSLVCYCFCVMNRKAIDVLDRCGRLRGWAICVSWGLWAQKLVISLSGWGISSLDAYFCFLLFWCSL